MGDLTENFSRSEFLCRCGCGQISMKMELVERLQRVRNRFGPIAINSGYRCETRNARISGSPNSSHLRGWAADLACESKMTRFFLLKALISEGFDRIGVGEDFIHCDSDPDKLPSILWLYPPPQ